ncbi:hypothetical protein [Novosphingobium sp.]|uniref:hypothetical protein n=1 Tax=Novosphingobium sp. TaxID=1874826 RepID=UPI0027327EF1|nr:hypothetical protein [Novosphingobium sp.]MDP3906326.1 hypothetical protein [Novosphingobium sp.]
MNRLPPIRLSILGAALAVLAAPAAAKDKEPPSTPPPVFQAVLDCKGVAEAAERLACYDRTVGAMATARDTKDLVIADRATMREARRGLFGLSLPTIKLFGGGDSEDVTAIESTIESTYTARDGQFIFVLADGARWKQIAGRPAYAKRGDPILIETASLGSYFAKIGKGQNARVIRIQ